MTSPTNITRMIRSAYTRPLDVHVVSLDGKIVTGSRSVASSFGKRHADVLRGVDALIAEVPTPLRIFAQGSYTLPTTGSQQHRMYYMDRDGFSLLAMGFTGKRAIGWKLKFIEAFNAMEQQITGTRPKKLPLTVDGIDAGMDLLLVAETALYAEGMIDGDVLRAVRGTIEQARKMLEPTRAAINDDI